MYRCLKKVSGVGTGNDIYFWKIKDCLMKMLQLLLQVIVA